VSRFNRHSKAMALSIPEAPRQHVWQWWLLSEDTSPAAIAATQAAVVRESARKLGPTATAEQISESVCLPVWNVKRILEDLKGAS
jgi:hypothetical protein